MPETHLFRYRFNDRTYTVDIVADSPQEAHERIKALAWAKYDGTLVARVPVAYGWMVRPFVFLRNLVRA